MIKIKKEKSGNLKQAKCNPFLGQQTSIIENMIN